MLGPAERQVADEPSDDVGIRRSRCSLPDGGEPCAQLRRQLVDQAVGLQPADIGDAQSEIMKRGVARQLELRFGFAMASLQHPKDRHVGIIFGCRQWIELECPVQ